MPVVNNQSVLSVQKLNVSLGGRAVIRDLSFEVARGENLAVIGPNGAGKTVLLRALLNLLPTCCGLSGSEEIVGPVAILLTGVRQTCREPRRR